MPNFIGKFKVDKLKTRLLLMRWAVLGCLVLAVGAVAVWSGARPEQNASRGVNGLLTARQSPAAQVQLADQLQAHIGEDTQPVSGINIQMPDKQGTAPVIEPENKPENEAENQPAENPANENANNTGNQLPAANETDSNPTGGQNAEASDEVIDHAPEPWVGDELLTVEANLQQLLPPLSGSSGVLRGFGYGYDAAFDDYRFHGAVDLAGSLGAAVLAPLAGKIIEINEDSFYGTSIVLEHDGKLQTAYFGLKPQPGLQTGQEVIAGEKLGELCAPAPFESSDKGENTPHLHWEIHLDGETLNPADYL